MLCQSLILTHYTLARIWVNNPLHGASLCCSQTEREFFVHGALWHSVLGAGADAADLPLNSTSGEAMAVFVGNAVGDVALPGCSDIFVV